MKFYIGEKSKRIKVSGKINITTRTLAFEMVNSKFRRRKKDEKWNEWLKGEAAVYLCNLHFVSRLCFCQEKIKEF